MRKSAGLQKIVSLKKPEEERWFAANRLSGFVPVSRFVNTRFREGTKRFFKRFFLLPVIQ